MHEKNHFNRRLVNVGKTSGKSKTEDGKEGGYEFILAIFGDKKMYIVTLFQALFINNILNYELNYDKFLTAFESDLKMDFLKSELSKLDINADNFENMSSIKNDNYLNRYDAECYQQNFIEMGECGCKYLVNY